MDIAKLGDMVRVKDGEAVIAQGVVSGGALSSETHEHTSLSISTTFGDGFSVSGETWLHGVDPHQVEMVESGWAQKWQKRCYGR